MHRPVDPNWLLQSIVLVLTLALGFLYLVRDTALRYFTQLDSDDKSMRTTETAAGAPSVGDSCAVCRLPTTKHCSRCKMVKYCSEACQRSHWNSEHKKKCKSIRPNQKSLTSALGEKKASLSPPAIGSSKSAKQYNKILFPYEEFVKLFNLEIPGFPPCGLLNCGNSCFANVVLQCLTYTHPLVAYLLNRGHKRECRRNAWCFLCEFENHVDRSTRNSTPFSPISILSRLPNIGGNLGYGQQEDAHEFMRFAIDTMQSACLDEFGGEKSVHPIFQETTLIQHIFGGRLQSQVMCTECNNISNQFESMMDLTVEINGDVGSLEECLDQFTVKEWLHGDNMYKCDSCNAYVMAWKRLTIHRPPNVLTIALKRFQSGRFGKLNKKVTFPETFDLSPYMGDKEDSQNTYKLYAVIVHMDMLNASFFGHYICYVKDFSGNWYRVDDCEVAQVDVDEVLSQGAYMLMYKRICARPSSLLPSESLKNQVNEQTKIEVDNSLKQHADCSSSAICANGLIDPQNPSSSILSAAVVNHGNTPLSASNPECTIDDAEVVSSEAVLPVVTENECQDGEIMSSIPKEVSYSSIDEIPTESNGQKSEISLPMFVGENASRRNSDPTDDSARITDHESSGVAESCMLDEAINKSSHHMDEAPSEVKCSNSVSESGNSGNGSMPAHCSKEAIGITNGRTLGSKPKPLFASGFLDRKSRKDLNKLDNTPTKAYERLPENGQILKDEHVEAVEVDKRKNVDDQRAPSNTTNEGCFWE